ncbi:hypothetical protein D9M71_823470 [compost metagenome]
MFIIDHTGKNLIVKGMQDSQIDLQVIQGELSEAGGILAKTESWDELPPELLPRTDD